MKLPNGDRAYLGDKLERYCLNPNHSKGKNKANLFRQRLGITLEQKDVLKAALLKAASYEEAKLTRSDQFGRYYNTRFFVETDEGKAWVLGCWIVRSGEDFPRLTNAYPVRK